MYSTSEYDKLVKLYNEMKEKGMRRKSTTIVLPKDDVSAS